MNSSARSYIWRGVETNARVFNFLLRDLDENSPRWDAKPDADRFSLREVVAHLVDFDSITRDRFERIIREDKPELDKWNVDEAAAHYEARNPKHQLENLLVSRQELAVWLEGLTDDEWKRRGLQPGAGEISVEEGAALFLGHDSYHLAEVVEWLDATK